MKSDWVCLLPGVDGYDDYILKDEVPGYKVGWLQFFDMAWKMLMTVSMIGLLVVLAGVLQGGPFFAIGFIASMLSLWFRQLLYFHITKNYQHISKWYYDRIDNNIEANEALPKRIAELVDNDV